MAKKKSVMGEVVKTIKSDLSKSNFLSILRDTWNAAIKKWPFFILNIAIDIIFLIALSFSALAMQIRTTDHLTELMILAGEMTGGLANIYNQSSAASVTQGMIAMQNNALIQFHLRQVMKYIALLVLIVFFVWVILQGISWFIAYVMSINKEKRLSFKTFMKNFVIETIPFYTIYVALTFMLIFFIMRLSTTMIPLMGVDTLQSIFGVFSVIAAYFGFFCYTITRKNSLLNIKDAFKYGVMKFPYLYKTVLFIVLLIVGVDLILRIPFIARDPVIILLFGAILFLPAVSFSRMLLYKTRQEILPIKMVKKAVKK